MTNDLHLFRIICGGCTAGWAGEDRAHCGGCHVTYDSITLNDATALAGAAPTAGAGPRADQERHLEGVDLQAAQDRLIVATAA